MHRRSLLQATERLICIALALSFLPALSAYAQGDESRYFEETRLNVSGEFLRFYEEHGDQAIFGYPLTRQFTEDGRQVQYFQRARMELHPENPEPYRVQLGLLGDELGFRDPPIPASEIPPLDHPDKRYFPETGHTVTFAFLDFYVGNGGLDIFGYPITEWVIEPNGRIVQYFQRGKMEWYPKNLPGERVQLGMLGTIYVEQNVPPVYREPDDPPILSRTPTPAVVPTREVAPSPLPSVADLRIVATVRYPIIGSNDTQTVYVYVFDQLDRGVPAAVVEMEIQYADGTTKSDLLDPTNADGYTRSEFKIEIEDAPPGSQVILSLSARYGDLATQTSTTFLAWW
jgi:hypothetical protein